MKKFMFIVLVLILSGVLTACSSNKKLDKKSLEKSAYSTSQQSKDVTLSVKEKDIASGTESITLIYTNISDKEYSFGKEPHLEVELEGEWYVVPTLESAAWDEIGYLLSPKGSAEEILPVKDLYGQLAPGNYRIIKKLYSDGQPVLSIAEFKIQ